MLNEGSEWCQITSSGIVGWVSLSGGRILDGKTSSRLGGNTPEMGKWWDQRCESGGMRDGPLQPR